MAERSLRAGSGRRSALLQAPGQYAAIARLWIRSALAYPASFWILTFSSTFITLLDFVGLALMFHSIDRLGGFDLREVALLYGASGLGIGLADLTIGSVEQIGAHIRTGSLDTMLIRPVPLLVQVCADKFALRRLGRISQALVVFGWGASAVDWTPSRGVVALLMTLGSYGLFFALFTGFSCLQFWFGDASEVANAFTYGGNTITQYPLAIFPRELVVGMTFVLPLAFVNWYPCLYLLGREDPFGMPGWFALLPVPVALVMLAVAAAVFRLGVRHYTSTGS